MPCDSVPAGMTVQERERQIKASLARLEAQLGAGVSVVIGPGGAVAFFGWKDRDGVADVCAFRRLSLANSFKLRQAVQRAEAQAGRKVNPQAVGAGVHSHDDGATWHPGH